MTRRRPVRLATVAIAATVAIVAATVATLRLAGGRSPSAAAPASATWSAVSSPALAQLGDLRSVACPAPSACVAVGASATLGLPTALIDAWDGHGWSRMTAASRGVDSWLNATSCVTASWCVAVGGDSPTGDSDNPLNQTMVEVLAEGTWSVVPSPTPGNGDQNDLQGVSCTSRLFCVAVGSFSPVSNPYDPQVNTLIEAWDGSTWSVVAAPELDAGRQNVLKAVSCTVPSRCMAVGYSSSIGADGGSVGRTLAEQWNGQSWHTVPTPTAADLSDTSTLQSVACASISDCQAVGSIAAGGKAAPGDERTLVEHWDGHAWSVVSDPPSSGSTQSVLESISCSSSTSCVTVGSVSGGASLETQRALVASWRDTKWSTAANPVGAGPLAAVACVPSGPCIAVGKRQMPSPAGPAWQTYVEVSVPPA